LGPQLICDSLGKDSKINYYLIDNTDPDNIDLIPRKLVRKHGKTLFFVTSKPGSTLERRNAMIEGMYAYKKNGYSFFHHAIAIT
jgi:glucose-6-phosphate isomerase